MSVMFIVSLALMAAAFLLLLWLLWRARSTAVAKTAKAPASASAATGSRWRWVNIRDAVTQRYRTVERAVRYARARRDWRYNSQWLLLMGFPGDGKSSIAASVPDSMIRLPQRRDLQQEAWLKAAVPNTQWRFLEKGILIDPTSIFGEPAVTDASDPHWSAMLGDIDSLRPDRALDGLVWVVSAERLLSANEAERAAMGRYAYARVHEVQEAFAYALPVYVVVSHCDAVQGFSAFWMAQDEGLRNQIVGWSSPSIDDNGLPSEWVPKVFDKLIDGLRALVLQAAKAKESIKDVDDFFLFPRYMRSLQRPIQTFMADFFKPNVYEARSFCRGVYFTGVVNDNPTAVKEDTPRTDVSFLADLLDNKIFAEKRLAQRTQKGLLARNRLIRNLQLTLMGVGLALLVALPWTASQVNTRAKELRDTVVAISVTSKNLRQHTCLGEAQVYALILQVAGLNQRTHYYAIPLSWFDNRIHRGVVDVVSINAFQNVVLPSIACKLQERIDALSNAALVVETAQSAPDAAYTDDRKQLKRQLTELGTLEDNLSRFADVAQPNLGVDKRRLLLEFGALSEYVYGNPLPADALKEDTPLPDALVQATYADAPTIGDALRVRIGQQFGTMASNANADLLRRASAGVPLLATLQEGNAPILPPLRRFNSWLGWVQTSWLLSTPTDNPCVRIVEQIQPGIEELIKDHHYSSTLRNTLDYFNTEQCYQPAVDALRSATLRPYGALFTINTKTQELDGIAPALGLEATGLKDLADVAYMQVKSPMTYQCKGRAGGWQPNTFDQVLTDMRQYQVFANQHGVTTLAPPPSEPLYDQLARKQLTFTIQDSLERNQRVQVSDPDDSGMDATSQLDRKLSNESINASATLGPLLQTQRELRGLVIGDIADEVGQCAQNYASGMLLNVSDLVSSSHLYDPSLQTAEDDNTPLFDLGGVPVLQAYLDRQLSRVQILANYAAPFVSMLKGSNGVNNSQRLNLQTDVYWGNTINELNRAVQFADPAGQSGQLNDLFLKQLATMTYGNCVGLLNGYTAPAAGNDLFSLRRKALLQLAQTACTNRGESDSNLHYVRIGMLFNSQLAGRYPFGPASSHEVSLAIVKAFFVYYAKEKPDLETWLATAKGDKATQMKGFIDQLDKVQAFLGGNLLATPQSAPITVDVGFRALPGNSPISNQLIAWNLRSGGSTLSWPGTATSVGWNFGDPIALNLQWADRSHFTPLPDAAQTDLNVSGYQATFQGDGSWALLHMLNVHRISAASVDGLDPNQQLLQFQVPVLTDATVATGPANNGKAQLYLTLKLSAADPASKALVPLTLPVFPQSAPVLW